MGRILNDMHWISKTLSQVHLRPGVITSCIWDQTKVMWMPQHVINNWKSCNFKEVQVSSNNWYTWPLLKLICCCCCWVSSAVFSSVWPYGLQPARLLCPWDSSGTNTGEGFWALLQGTFPTRGSNPCLLHLPALAGGFFTTQCHLGSPSVL